MIDELVKLANHLDEKGLHSEANHLDKIIVMASTNQSILSKLMDIENSMRQLMRAANKLISHKIDWKLEPYKIFNKDIIDKYRNLNPQYREDVYAYVYSLYYFDEDIKKLMELKSDTSFVIKDVLEKLINKLNQFFNKAYTLEINNLIRLFEDEAIREARILNNTIRKNLREVEQELAQFSEYEEELPA